MTETQGETVGKAELPVAFVDFVKQKMNGHEAGGRPHFLKQLAKSYPNVEDEVLNIVEKVWVKGQSVGNVAHTYKTKYHTLFRLLKELEPWKEGLAAYVMAAPRRKRFYIRELNESDYETVQNYIRRAKRQGLKRYIRSLSWAEKCWKYLNYHDPETWTADEVSDYLATLSGPSQFPILVAIRQVAPQIRERSNSQYVGTGNAKEKMGRHKLDLFGPEVHMIIKALVESKLDFHALIFKLHVATGAREGTTDSTAGICGLSWDRFKKNFETVDLYESKVKGGIWWRDSPLDLLFPELPMELQTLWKERGKPTDAKLIHGGYPALIHMYSEIASAVKSYCEGRVDAHLLAEFAKLRPHGADKLHVNLLWEARVPLEVVAGQYLGRGEGIGLVGRGWLDLNTLKNHYLSLTKRSKRFGKIMERIKAYSQHTFKEVATVSEPLEPVEPIICVAESA